MTDKTTHKPGCEALGGYGHGVGPCSCSEVQPENEAEKFIQAAIDSAPDQFRRLGEFLSRVLDEDQWKTAERLILGGLVAIQDGRDVQGDIDHYNESMERK